MDIYGTCSGNNRSRIIDVNVRLVSSIYPIGRFTTTCFSRPSSASKVCQLCLFYQDVLSSPGELDQFSICLHYVKPGC